MEQHNNEWELINYYVDNAWITHRLKVPNGWLYKTTDKFNVTDIAGTVSMVDWKVTVTFVPE